MGPRPFLAVLALLPACLSSPPEEAHEADAAAAPDAVVAGCPGNLIPGTFESSLDGWKVDHVAVGFVDQGRHGTALHLCPDVDGALSGFSLEFEHFTTVEVGQTYFASGFVRAAASSVMLKLQLKLKTVDDLGLQSSSNDGMAGSDWTELNQSITAAQSAGMVQPTFDVDPTTECLDFDDMCLQLISQ